MTSNEPPKSSKIGLDNDLPTSGMVVLRCPDECKDPEDADHTKSHMSCKWCLKKEMNRSDSLGLTSGGEDDSEKRDSLSLLTALKQVSFMDNSSERSTNKLGDDNSKFISCRRRSSHGVYTPKMDAVEFRKRGKEMIDYVTDYFESVDEMRIFPLVEPGYLHKLIPPEAPIKPETWEEIMNDVENVIMPGVTHWQHPNFHAYFPAAHSYPAMCADILSGGFGAVAFTWESNPAFTELELAMMDWLAKMLQLPKEFHNESGIGGGIIYGSGSEATLVSFLTARNKIIGEIRNKDPQFNPYVVLGKLVGYFSDEAHACAERAGLLGMIRMRMVKTVDRKLKGSVLQTMIEEDIEKGFIPFYCFATLGTTGSCAFDDLEEIGPICKRFNIWLHVDAAYAGSAFICPELRHFLNGIEYAMSFVFNPHKWLLINFDCSTAWFRDKKYFVESFREDPPYLNFKEVSKDMDFRRWNIQFGCRFRALKVWFVLRLYGIDGLQKYIRNHVKLAHLFENLISSEERFEIVEKVTLGIVCFRLKGSNEVNHELYTRIIKDGRIHLVTAMFSDPEVLYLRLVVCYQFATEAHIRFAFCTIMEIADEMDLPDLKNTN